MSDAATLARTLKIPGYRILGVIGEGAMGAVLRARQLSMDRDVAIKVLSPEIAGDPEFVGRFQREARAVAALRHENLVDGIDVGVVDDLHYLVMEYVAAPSLATILDRRGRLSEAECIHIVKQVARALAHAHEHGLVHRDIKPENILIDDEGRARLCDLGLAKRVTIDPNLTREGMAVGTPHYISPEQARGERDIDARSDLYSLGATLYRMATGRFPFDGDDSLVIMTKHVTDDPVPPRRLVRELSPGFERLILRLMAKSPEKRPASAPALLDEIDRMKRGTRSTKRVAPSRVTRLPPRRRAPILPIAAGIAVALGAAVWLMWPKPPPPKPPAPEPKPIVHVETPKPPPKEPVIEETPEPPPVVVIEEKPAAVVVEEKPPAVVVVEEKPAPKLPLEIVPVVESLLSARDVPAARAQYPEDEGPPQIREETTWYYLHRDSIDLLDGLFETVQAQAPLAVEAGYDFAASRLPGKPKRVESIVDENGARALAFTTRLGEGEVYWAVGLAPARDNRLLHADDVLYLLRRAKPERYELLAGLFLYYEGRLAEARELLEAAPDAPAPLLAKLKDVPALAEEAEASRLHRELKRWMKRKEPPPEAAPACERLLDPLARTRAATENRAEIEAWAAQLKPPEPTPSFAYTFDKPAEADDFEGMETRVADGAMAIAGSGTLFWKRRLRGDFTIEATLVPTGETNVGLVAHAAGPMPNADGYAVVFRPKVGVAPLPQDAVLLKTSVGAGFLDTAQGVFEMKRDEPFTVVWSRRGAVHEISVGGKPLLERDDAEFDAGRFGFYIQASGMRIDALKIEGTVDE